MPSPAAIARAARTRQGELEKTWPGIVTVSWTDAIGAVSLEVMAHVWKSDIREMRVEAGFHNVQSIRVDVRKTLLPRKPVGVKIECDGDVFDVSPSVAGDNAGDQAWILRAQRIV